MMFSVLMSVYFRDNSTFLQEALSSIFRQTLLPNELVIVQDGDLTEDLNNVIASFKHCYPSLVKIVELPQNVGLGNALNIGLEHCSYEIIARMDSDDICNINRFHTQLNFFASNPEISVLGSFVEEFSVKVGDLRRTRRVPLKPREISKYARYRNPLNHPSVMFKKSAVIDSGSYIEVPLFEDYYLWARMLLKGCKLANIDLPLLNFRVGNGMVGRRHGWSYLKNELRFLKLLLAMGFLSKNEFIFSVTLKLPVRVIPKSLLELIYNKFLRKKLP